MKVELINYTGNDLMVVNSARVSLGKQKDIIDESDIKLISYLIKNQHLSTLEHCFFTFRLEIPIYIARQLMRHRSWSFNEISGRYVEFTDSFFTPDNFRLQDKNIKQGSKIDTDNLLDQDFVSNEYKSICDNAYQGYKKLLDLGVCKEQARGVLPLALYTQLYATCNIRSFFTYLKLRLDGHAQVEIRDISNQMLELVKNIPDNPFKYTIEAFKLGEN